MSISDRLLGKKNVNGKPHIEAIAPEGALPGGEVRIGGKGLRPPELKRPSVLFGELEGSVLISSDEFANSSELINTEPSSSPKRTLGRFNSGGRNPLPPIRTSPPGSAPSGAIASMCGFPLTFFFPRRRSEILIRLIR